MDPKTLEKQHLNQEYPTLAILRPVTCRTINHASWQSIHVPRGGPLTSHGPGGQRGRHVEQAVPGGRGRGGCCAGQLAAPPRWHLAF